MVLNMPMQGSFQTQETIELRERLGNRKLIQGLFLKTKNLWYLEFYFLDLKSVPFPWISKEII